MARSDSPLDNAVERLLDASLVRATIKRESGERISVRPVEIKGQRVVQVSSFDGRKTDVKNHLPCEFEPCARALVSGAIRSIVVSTAAEEMHVQFSRKGRPVMHLKRRTEPGEASLRHDRTIARPLPEGEPDRLLQAIGLMTADGRVRADRQRKFIQINEFIRIVLESADLRALSDKPLLIVDFGCGNAYLSFALHHYLSDKLGIQTELIGVDRTADIIARNVEKAAELGGAGIHFETSGIAEYVAPRPADIVTALHACDTATDEALAKALGYGAKLIFAAPCCHHNLQAQAGFLSADGVHRPILSDGILRERLGDLVTDTLRALILRIAGYHVDVIEFTAPEHTAKNLLIRARKTGRRQAAGLIQEYEALKAEFGVTPYLETILPAGELEPRPA
ncbi:MAG: class I SAM-dependent methyltransferase [Fimbriimonadaceae bacterium]